MDRHNIKNISKKLNKKLRISLKELMAAKVSIYKMMEYVKTEYIHPPTQDKCDFENEVSTSLKNLKRGHFTESYAINQ